MSEARKVDESQSNKQSFNPMRMWLKAMGTLADSATMQGKAVKMLEERMSRSITKLSGSDAFLEQMGKAMERSYLMRAQANRNLEKALASMRIPSTSDIDDLRELMLNLTDKVEALGFQMEEVVERMESLEARMDAQNKAPAKRAPRRGGNKTRRNTTKSEKKD